MSQIVIAVYDFFQNRRLIFILSFIGIILILIPGILIIELEEDITQVFPHDDRIEKFDQIFQGSRFAEQLIMAFTLNDSSDRTDPNLLIDVVNDWQLQSDLKLSHLVKKMDYKLDDEKILDVFDHLLGNLPIFLEPSDYEAIDSLIELKQIKKSLQNNYKELSIPSGIIAKKVIAKDPIGISSILFKKLEKIGLKDEFMVYDQYIFSNDLKSLILRITPSNPSSETKQNSDLIDVMDEMISSMKVKYPEVSINYFGNTAVAVGNAKQIKKDVHLTASFTVFFLVVFLYWFFRRKRVSILILLPAILGILFSVTCIYLIQGSISLIALSAGSIILGVSVSFSMHFFSDLRYKGNVKQVLKHISKPMALGSFTTVLAFLGLQFANASVLKDIGLFAAFSLIGSVLCTLFILPQFVKDSTLLSRSGKNKFSNAIINLKLSENKFLVTIILVLTPFFLYLAGDVEFNSNMNEMNYMSDELKKSEKVINEIIKYNQKSIFLVISAPNLESTLRDNENFQLELKELKREGIIDDFTSVADFILSDSTKNARIAQWKKYWDLDKRNNLESNLIEQGNQIGFKSNAFDQFYYLLNKDFVLNPGMDKEISSQLFPDFIIEGDDLTTVVSLVEIKDENREMLISELNQRQGLFAFDKQILTSVYVELVQSDFRLILFITSIIVFMSLLVVYGRIELALITFLPMLITWIWILGLMAILGIEFNLINVMISTFIFGLGDDYSIFIMDGLQFEHRYRKEQLNATITSIFISAFAAILGLGMLLFSKHPALKSIASISVIGIISVFLMAQTLEPFFFSKLIRLNAKHGNSPATLLGLCKSIFVFSLFILGSLTLSLIGFLLLRLNPFFHNQFKYIFHVIINKWVRLLIFLTPRFKKKVIGYREELFNESQVIIANHQSVLDIILMLSIHPKIILMTNDWVWNSPLFGRIVKMADFFTINYGVDQLDKLREKIDDGYSIVIFPEGSRSSGGTIRRFHKGAFFIAQEFNLPILPIMIHKSGDIIGKGSYYMHEGNLFVKILPRINKEDNNYGPSYQTRTKLISKYFKEEYILFCKEVESPEYFQDRIINNYKFKGPILEWYLRFKLKFENQYTGINDIIPENASVLDLGCGYGFMSYMLHYCSENREILGVDYDEEKIDTAKYGLMKTENLQFKCMDMVSFQFPSNDVILIMDTLHYLTHDERTKLLRRCFESTKAQTKIIIRDSFIEMKDQYRRSKINEFFSVKIFRFNKTKRDLSFPSLTAIQEIADNYKMKVEISNKLSNLNSTTLVIQKKD